MDCSPAMVAAAASSGKAVSIQYLAKIRSVIESAVIEFSRDVEVGVIGFVLHMVEGNEDAVVRDIGLRGNLFEVAGRELWRALCPACGLSATYIVGHA